MSDNIRMARELDYLTLPDSLIVTMDEAIKLPAREIVFIATGTQGEPTAALNRLAAGKHRQLAIVQGDTIILSAHPIPGNEESVSRTINNLMRRGANVIYDALAPVHVSGHASQEEQKLMIGLVRPRYFVPVHGELRQLRQHALLAEQVGIPRERIAVIENGTIIEFDQAQNMTIGERIPGGYVFVDGPSVGEITFDVLHDRKMLARHGVVLVSAVVNRETGQVIGQPQMTTHGFLLHGDPETLLNTLCDAVRHTLDHVPLDRTLIMDGTRATIVQEALGKLIRNELRRRPKIFALVTEI